MERGSFVFDFRVKSYRMFLMEKFRNPTLVELSELWGATQNTTKGYVHRCKSTGEYDFKMETHFHARWDLLPAVCELIYERHGVYPAQTELATLYGVSRQRVEQIMRRLEERNIKCNVREQTKIKWPTGILKEVERRECC